MVNAALIDNLGGIADLDRVSGLVSHDVFLLHGTVREGLVYSAPDSNDARSSRGSA